jgi:hypothetical protein
MTANFCLECWNEFNRTNDPESMYVFTKELTLCESCEEWRPVIVIEKKYYYQNIFRKIFFPFCVLFFPLKLILKTYRRSA